MGAAKAWKSGTEEAVMLMAAPVPVPEGPVPAVVMVVTGDPEPAGGKVSSL